MKKCFKIFGLFLSLIVLFGCGKDNYETPESTLNGKVTYKGTTLNLRGTGEAIQLQLYQDGYDKHDPIPVYVRQDGSFSAKLFDGEYKMVTRDGNGPWVNTRDTTHIDLKGHTEVQIEVTPFFTITDEHISVSESLMKASFTLNQIVSSAKVEKVMLILAKTQFVDDINNVFRVDISEDITNGHLDYSIDIQNKESVIQAKSLFGRIGVLTVGADQSIYSSVIRLR